MGSFFDGLTAWTVNHLNIVPEWFNRTAHLLFFVLMDITIIITAEYMYDQVVGFRKKKETLLLAIPGMLMIALTIAGIGQLHYIEGKTTWYSMGFSVYTSFATLILYYGVILFFMITRHRFLSKNKILGTLSYIVIAGTILIVQVIFPEVLLTSIFPTILLLGIYIDFENPSIRKITLHKDEMIDGFATMVESRDNNTGGHIKRTRAYVDLILKKMRHDRKYHEILNKDYATNVRNAAPLHARIMAIADVFDAVSQKRCYRDAMQVDECFAIIEKGIGADFDPGLAKLFLEAREEVERLMKDYGLHEPEK